MRDGHNTAALGKLTSLAKCLKYRMTSNNHLDDLVYGEVMFDIFEMYSWLRVYSWFIQSERITSGLLWVNIKRVSCFFIAHCCSGSIQLFLATMSNPGILARRVFRSWQWRKGLPSFSTTQIFCDFKSQQVSPLP